jgi:putative LysE/RhtB family amino acid efflux pump
MGSFDPLRAGRFCYLPATRVISYFLIGAAIGALTGVPIGPVNVAVIESAYRHHLRRAIAVGLGGALADFAYALLGVLGVGPFLRAHPTIPPILYAISGIVLIIYGALTVRTQPAALTEAGTTAEPQAGALWMGFVVGVVLILLNPAAIITWVVIVGSFLAEGTQMEGVSAAVGIGFGSLAWFTLVAYLADHGKRVLGDKMVWVTRIVGILLIAYGVFSLGRACWWAIDHFDVF